MVEAKKKKHLSICYYIYVNIKWGNGNKSLSWKSKIVVSLYCNEKLECKNIVIIKTAINIFFNLYFYYI